MDGKSPFENLTKNKHRRITPLAHWSVFFESNLLLAFELDISRPASPRGINLAGVIRSGGKGVFVKKRWSVVASALATKKTTQTRDKFKVVSLTCPLLHLVRTHI